MSFQKTFLNFQIFRKFFLKRDFLNCLNLEKTILYLRLFFKLYLKKYFFIIFGNFHLIAFEMRERERIFYEINYHMVFGKERRVKKAHGK